MEFHPTPGIAVIQVEDPKTPIYTGTKPPSKNLIGKVVAIGDEGITKFGAIVKPPCRVGDVVVFLSYAEVGEYDVLEIANQTYYMVEFLDCRCILENYD